MSERQLERVCPEGSRDQLVTKADSKHRYPLFRKSEDRVRGLPYRGGVARPIRDKQAIWLFGKDLPPACVRRNHRHAAPMLGKKLGRVRLHAEVIRQDVESLLSLCRDHIPLLRGHAGGEIQPLHHGLRPHLREKVCFVDGPRRDPAPHRPQIPDVPGERPRVYSGDPHDSVLGQILRQSSSRPPR